MENNAFKPSVFIVAIIALLIGFAGGLMYGKTKGKEEGRAMLLAEQEAVAQEEIAERTNPFADGQVNPFEGSTVNPFAR